MDLDRVLVMDCGSVVEDGNPEDLIGKAGSVFSKFSQEIQAS
jgi:ABC-type multidrug transport system fused ATPase/permease subunit